MARGAGHLRKCAPAARNYAVARLASDVGLRINEARMLDLDDVRWELGRFGKPTVRHGKGSRRRGRLGQRAAASRRPMKRTGPMKWNLWLAAANRGICVAEEVCPVELREQQLGEAVLVRCRSERIEPPGRIDRILGAARSAFEHRRFCDRVIARLGAERAARLEALVVDGGWAGVVGGVEE